DIGTGYRERPVPGVITRAVCSGADRGAAARWTVRRGVPVHARAPVDARVAVHRGGLRRLVRLVALPVRDEVPESVHQPGRLYVLLAVGLDRVDRVGETRRVLHRRELTLHAGEGGLAVRRRVDGGSAAGDRSAVLLNPPRCLRDPRRGGGCGLGRGWVRGAAGMGDGDAPEE